MAGKKVQNAKCKVQSSRVESGELPAGWDVTNFENVLTQIIGGGTPSKSNGKYFSGSIPFMTVKDLTTRFPIDTIDHISQEAIDCSATTYIPADTLIIATRMSLGKIVRPRFATAINQDLKALILCDGIDKTFIEYFWKSRKDYIQSLGTGTTVQGIRLDDIRNLQLPLAPLPEQKVIAEKLDALLAQVDSLKARLDAIPAVLKRFRQSVLSAAVSGKLTEDWRGGKAKNWKAAKLKDIIQKIEAGKSLSCIEVPPQNYEYGIIKISAVTWGEFNENESKTLPSNELFIENRRIKTGDFLISRANTIELVGNPVIVKAVTKNLMLSDKVLRLVMNEEYKGWLILFLRSASGRKEIEARSTGNQLSMRNIGQSELLDIDFPLPPLPEQTEIVRRVEQLFAFADQVEARVKAAQSRTQHLTQAILAKAFRGELTAEWRNEHGVAHEVG